ncbi:MAG: putative ATP-dependent DNA helicase [Candidatus Peregrinibacteria bacterium Greene0416_62]|nr:MAG: putative ATP-dependent DNA helicase [Candidatus Peregrinibacteria bacterium Greene0416_62]
MQTLTSTPLDTKVTVRGVVSSLKLIRTRNRKVLVQALFTDQEGAIAHITWFNQPHIMRMIKDGDDVALTGKITESGYKLQMSSPQFELAGRRPLVHSGRLVPMYPSHSLISTKWLREKMVLLKDTIDLLPETLPAEILKEENLLDRCSTIRVLHFPEDPKEVDRALDRLAFEEMFHVQRDALERKREMKKHTSDRIKIPMDVEMIRKFFTSLKFTPTGSQKIAIYEILKDMELSEPMSRLLEGDVGSGKTLVATAVMANVLRHGGQCALMVPTEVLARQHSESIGKTLINFHTFIQKTKKTRLPSIALLTGSTPLSESQSIKRGIASGTVDLVIGTHALIEETVQFKDLKLVIVDEQHRFGVAQRQRLAEKGSPHFLAMTATPIPRTLALTAYGHHDLSVLLEKPGNRKVIATKVVSPRDRFTVERFIDHQIGEGRQVFVICPLITTSVAEGMEEVRSVEKERERLSKEFPRRRIAMLHGKLIPAEKEQIMRAFKDRRFDILVSTSVIEVGIDVPNATIICIEGSERFGLSQLHQFRGRTGRSDHQSHCFLFTSTPEQASSARLKAMEKHDSGFLLAEIDLKLRGPGELFGLRQSGIPESKLGMLLNPEIVVRARRAAEKFLATEKIG